MLIHMSPIYIDNISHLAYLVCFLTDIKVRRVLECLAIFCYRKKMDQRICIKLCVKNKIKCSKAIEMMTMAFGESTWSKSMFISGTGASQKAEKMLMTTRKVRSNVKGFSSITMAWCIVSSCQKVVRSITNITLKLCAVCVKQYEKTPAFVAKQFLAAYLWFFGQKEHSNRISATDIHRTWPPATFSCSKNSKNPWKGGDLARSRRLRPHRWKAIPKSAYQKSFEYWKKRWHKCILSRGDYFEGDRIDIDK